MFNKYPYTDFHELNLDWVIKEIKRLSAEVDPLYSEFEQLRQQVDNLLSVMQAEVQRAVSEYVPEAMAPYIAQINGLIAEITALRDQMAGWDEQLQILRREYSMADDNLKIDYISRISDLRFDMLSEILRLDNRIDHLQDELPDIYNLVKGYTTNIAYVIYDVYDACRYGAYTALQYALAGLTAQELDDLDREALDLDVNGYTILYPIDRKCLNPLTGVRDNICDILADLALFASTRTWTALIWDGTWDQDATTIDALDLTAFDFDYSDAAQP